VTNLIDGSDPIVFECIVTDRNDNQTVYDFNLAGMPVRTEVMRSRTKINIPPFSGDESKGSGVVDSSSPAAFDGASRRIGRGKGDIRLFACFLGRPRGKVRGRESIIARRSHALVEPCARRIGVRLHDDDLGRQRPLDAIDRRPR
jgi:hypothetical protein